MKKKGCTSKLGRCLAAPFRALSRACDSACKLYVRGMSGYARRMPAAAGAVAVGRGFGRPTTATTNMHLRESSDRRDDLVRAAAKQQQQRPVAAVKNGVVSQAAALEAKKKKKGGAGMGPIAENGPCDFSAAGCAPRPKTRAAAADGMAARGGGFGAMRTGSAEAFALAPTGAGAWYTSSAAVCT